MAISGIPCSMVLIPWESRTKQRMVFRMIHEKNTPLEHIPGNPRFPNHEKNPFIAGKGWLGCVPVRCVVSNLRNGILHCTPSIERIQSYDFSNLAM